MYYRINWSIDTLEIGKVYDGQANKALYPGSAWDEAIPKNNLFKRMDEAMVVTQTPVLSLRAKLTDLISGSALGSGLELMISDKLKRILARQDPTDIQFFPMQVMHKKNLVPGYWIVHPASVNIQPVDFKKSTIRISESSGQPAKDIVIEDVSAFNKIRNQLSLESKSLCIERLVLVETVESPFFHLNFVSGGVGYYVSEGVRSEIELANCSGIVFTELNEIYP